MKTRLNTRKMYNAVNAAFSFVDYIDWRGDSNYKKNRHFGKKVRNELRKEMRACLNSFKCRLR